VVLLWAAWRWFTGVNVAPAIEGRIVDVETGLPVEGAHVFVGYNLMVTPLGSLLSLGGATTRFVGFQATRSGHDGSFRFEKLRLPPWNRAGWNYSGASLSWVHESYGWGDLYEARLEEHGDFRIDRDADEVAQLRSRDMRAIEGACDVNQPRTCMEIVLNSLSTQTEVGRP
jgi:hypothetical protein